MATSLTSTRYSSFGNPPTGPPTNLRSSPSAVVAHTDSTSLASMRRPPNRSRAWLSSLLSAPAPKGGPVALSPCRPPRAWITRSLVIHRLFFFFSLFFFSVSFFLFRALFLFPCRRMNHAWFCPDVFLHPRACLVPILSHHCRVWPVAPT
ncbi:uncharacterized protein IWZ02DRAFT_308317 [Phyllosticta citriasiana]|uniref:uncharacterized protein n=1 Tax=Phyllosticta citriasiana TaxID=595635 RepID=UPI0030FD96E8